MFPFTVGIALERDAIRPQYLWNFKFVFGMSIGLGFVLMGTGGIGQYFKKFGTTCVHVTIHLIITHGVVAADVPLGNYESGTLV